MREGELGHNLLHIAHLKTADYEPSDEVLYSLQPTGHSFVQDSEYGKLIKSGMVDAAFITIRGGTLKTYHRDPKFKADYSVFLVQACRSGVMEGIFSHFQVENSGVVTVRSGLQTIVSSSINPSEEYGVMRQREIGFGTSGKIGARGAYYCRCGGSNFDHVPHGINAEAYLEETPSGLSPVFKYLAFYPAVVSVKGEYDTHYLPDSRFYNSNYNSSFSSVDHMN